MVEMETQSLKKGVEQGMLYLKRISETTPKMKGLSTDLA